MYKRFLWIVACAFSLALSQSAFSDSWGCGEGLNKMLQELKLDDAQQAKLKPIMEQQKATMKDLGDKMNALDTKINEQMNAPTVDQAALDDLVNQKVTLIGAMIKAKVMTKVQIYGLLTPAQKTTLQDMMTKLEEKVAAKFKACHQDD
ncbi:Spy/CpxP family protein refolding chaperone [uncultured Legionella sp.]|uniref:Spy/CpxP family protein refolding chaperone n=1 Tax=uncultured Legionella sp. TaxID=210934 RepID=UPI00262AAC8D|nr:Spy/CpxP family protein refolding chaperone [uncultured Legionella sp.]